MKVEIELSMSLPDKTSRFDEYADEVVYSQGDGQEIPHVQGNLVQQVQLLDRLFKQAREHLLLQMDDSTRAAMPYVHFDTRTAYAVPGEQPKNSGDVAGNSGCGR